MKKINLKSILKKTFKKKRKPSKKVAVSKQKKVAKKKSKIVIKKTIKIKKVKRINLKSSSIFIFSLIDFKAVSLIRVITKTVNDPNIEDKEEYLNIRETTNHVKINKKLN